MVTKPTFKYSITLKTNFMFKTKIVIGLTFLFAMILSANKLSAQRRYSGSSHTSSHGGHYSGGSGGSSHKGGSYRHASTSNHYGRHKR